MIVLLEELSDMSSTRFKCYFNIIQIHGHGYCFTLRFTNEEIVENLFFDNKVFIMILELIPNRF